MAVSFLGVLCEPTGGVSGASWTAFSSSVVVSAGVWTLAVAGDCGGVGEVTIGVVGWLRVSTSVFDGIVTVGLESALGDPCFASVFTSDAVFGSSCDFVSVEGSIMASDSVLSWASGALSVVGCTFVASFSIVANGVFSIGAKLDRGAAILAIGIVGIGAETSDTLRMPCCIHWKVYINYYGVDLKLTFDGKQRYSNIHNAGDSQRHSSPTALPSFC